MIPSGAPHYMVEMDRRKARASAMHIFYKLTDVTQW
jgi:hypothetical protein